MIVDFNLFIKNRSNC